MEPKSFPIEIQSYLNANLNSFSASIYLKEKEIDVVSYLNDIKETEFSHFKFEFFAKCLITTKKTNLFKIDISKTSINRDPVKGYFFLIEDNETNSFIAITPGNMKFLRRVVHTFLQKYLYEIISRVYINSKDIYNSIQLLQKSMNMSFYTRWCTGKRLFSETPDTLIKFMDKLIPFEDAFSQARKQKMSINWIQLESSKTKKIKFSISRTCDISSNLETLPTIYKIILNIINKGKETKTFLSGRELVIDSDAKPIVLKYNGNILEDLDKKRKLINTINKYNQCNYSVIHGGNPHIYLYISDKLDKSSFSLRSVGSDELLIIPLLKSSYSSLIRFIEFLSENFVEYEKLTEI